MVCEFCGGQTKELARTHAQVWLACRQCHRTWKEDAARILDSSDTERPTTGIPRATPPIALARACVIAVAAVALAFSLRLALRPIIGSSSPFLLFTPAVMLAAFYGGLIPGALATGVGALLGNHFFLQTLGEPGLERWDRIALFLLVGALITWLNVESRNARAKLDDSLWREQAARAEAEAANRTKDEFLALVSHELQTPASVILGWASMLRKRPTGGVPLERALDAIERNARLQSRLVADVLDTSRIVSGTLRLDRQPADVGPIVSAAIEQIRPAADRKGVSIDLESDSEEYAVLGDPVRLQQVFANLLSNAVKFTPASGEIHVRISASPTHVRIVVSDTGIGIDPAFLPRLFQRFQQDPRTLSHSRTGLGLGLSIARHFVERHGGTISVESAGRGQGSTFTVVLPRHKRPATVDAALDAETSAKALDAVSVLIVEDDDDTRMVLTTTLERYGARVTGAASAGAARDLAAQVRPDVMLCDLRMPVEDGIDLVKSLRSLDDQRLAAIPAASMTASARPEDRERALAAGYQVHLQKPIEPEELVSVVRMLAGGTGDASAPTVH